MAGEKAKQLSQVKPSRCGVVLLCLSAISLALFIYTATCLAKYTPLYTPMECLEEKSGLSPPHMGGGWINITGSTKKTCQNPNSYALAVSQLSPGEVFLLKGNSTLMPLGSSFMNKTSFPAHGEGHGLLRMEIAVPAEQAQALLMQPLLRIVTKLQVRSDAELSFLGVGIRSGADKDEVCGFEVRLSTKKVGPSACAGSLEELTIPGVDTERQPHLVHMSPEQLAAGSRKKNLAFGLLLALFGVVFLVSSLLALRRFCCGPSAARDVEGSSLATEQV